MLNEVQSRHYDAASHAFGHGVHGAVDRALFTLSAALGETGAMAGSDPAGVAWAAQYDPAVMAVISAVGGLSAASVRLAAMLERTGFNHGLAESASDPRGVVATPADTARYVVSAPASCALAVPFAVGGSVGSPHGWGLLKAAVGYVWPDGDPGRLRAAAVAWTDLADVLDAQLGLVGEACASVLAQSSAEVHDAWRVCDSMGTHLTDTATVCRSLATACTGLAGHIEKAHHDVVQEVVQFVEWTVGIEAAGGLFAVFTAGLSEAAAQTAEAARITETGTKIAALLAKFTTAANTVTESIRTVTTTIGAVTERLEVIVNAKLTTATVTLARLSPEFAGEAGAMLRLSKTAETEAKIARVEARATGAGGAGGGGSSDLATELSNAPVWKERRLPLQGGPPDGVLVKIGNDGKITNYARYDKNGRIVKRVDIGGKGHHPYTGQSHVHVYRHNPAPDGTVRVGESGVRAPEPGEDPSK